MQHLGSPQNPERIATNSEFKIIEIISPIYKNKYIYKVQIIHKLAKYVMTHVFTPMKQLPIRFEEPPISRNLPGRYASARIKVRRNQI